MKTYIVKIFNLQVGISKQPKTEFDSSTNERFLSRNLSSALLDVIKVACPTARSLMFGALSQYVALQTQTKLLFPKLRGIHLLSDDARTNK